MVDERVLCAGFGDQGVMSLGQLLAYAGMFEDRQVTWFPSYGPEMRGGTACCSVVISDHQIGSPIVTGGANCAIIMNLPSLMKFETSVIPGGHILLNSSLIDSEVERSDVHPCYIPADTLARRCGDRKTANMVMLGAYISVSGMIRPESIMRAFPKVFGNRSAPFIEQNHRALQLGMAAARNTGARLAA